VTWIRLLCAMIATIGLTACTPACQPAPDLEPRVTCAGVRALRVGMSKSDVIDLIGKGRAQGVTSGGTDLWTYAEGQFSLEFDAQGTLLRATAGLSMMRLTEHPTRVFLLSTPGVAGEEGDQFDRFFRCR